MVGGTLNSVDAEKFPVAEGEQCPRCETTLHDIEPHPNGRACPDCEFRADLADFEDMGLSSRAFAAVLSRLWPETRPIAIVLGAVAGAVAHLTGSVIGAAVPLIVGILLYGYSPSTYCLTCGYSVSTTEGFCANCGETIDDVDAIVEEPDADDALTRAWTWVDDRTPEGVTLGVPNVEFETARLGWVDQLVDGAGRDRWRRVFDGGIVLMAVSQLVAIIGCIAMLWIFVTTDGGSSASSGSASLSPTWAWLLPAATIAIAFLSTVMVHELGHCVSAAVDGYDPKKVGIVLTFGIPVLGWARNQDEGDEAPRRRLRILSAGILFNLVSGLAAFAVAVALGYPLLSMTWASPLAIFLVAFGWVSLASVPTNAIPLGNSDGGQFAETVWEMIQEWRSPDVPPVPDASLGERHRLAEGYDV